MKILNFIEVGRMDSFPDPVLNFELLTNEQQLAIKGGKKCGTFTNCHVDGQNSCSGGYKTLTTNCSNNYTW